MDKIIKILRENNTICKILYQNWRGQTYEAHVSPQEFKVRLLKEKLHFEEKISEKLIEEFEQAVRDSKEESDSWNNDYWI